MSLSIHVEKKLDDFNLKIDLEVENGITGLLGYSGSGKTMTLKMIAGIVKPDKGSIVLNNRILFDSEKGIDLKPQQRNVGLMFQSYALFNHMSVYQNVAIGMKGKKEEKAKEIEKYLRLLEIEHLKDKKPKQLSGGQKQRVALARVLAQKPEILMLDEPFSALDSHLKFKLEEDFKKALETFEGVVLYISHNRQEIYRYCKQTAIVSEGQIIEVQDTSELFEHCVSVAAAKLTGCRNIARCTWKENGQVEVEEWQLILEGPFRRMDFDYVGLRDSYFHIVSELEGEHVIKVVVGAIFKMPDKIKLELWTMQNKKIILTCSPKQYEAIEYILNQKQVGLKITPSKLLLLKAEGTRNTSCNKKAILVVSFGSSYKETIKQTIELIEKDLIQAFPDYKLYRAFTSSRIRKALKVKGEVVDSVIEALQHLIEQGIKEVIIQPTFIINGNEYDQMYQDIEPFKEQFERIAIGMPLLYQMEDYFKVANAFKQSLGEIKEDEAIVCMGHGTEHFMSVSYAALDYVFKESTHPNIYMATIEAYPGLDQVIGQLKRQDYKKVRIIPFMIVAGHHALKDMQGIGEKSWVYRLEQLGYEVECVIKGLGESQEIRQIFIEHAQNAIQI